MTVDWRKQDVLSSNVFVNRDSGAICRVRKVDDSYAYLDILNGTGSNALQTAFSMPVAQYDAEFALIWRPATAEDLIGMEDEGYRPPANTGDWGQ